MKRRRILSRTSILILMSISASIFFHSCETANDLLNNGAVGKLEGEWTCDENSQYYKATNEIYIVTISADADNSAGIIIDNFYGLGDIGVKATISGLNITINTQNVEGGYEISGSGTISSNYQSISWSYTVDDGSGTVDHVTAVYTKK